MISGSTCKFDILDYPKEYSICLKTISFVLKKMVFNVSELNRLIKSLSTFNEKFFSVIIDEYGMIIPNNITTLLPIFNNLVKIYFLIGINNRVAAQHFKPVTQSSPLTHRTLFRLTMTQLENCSKCLCNYAKSSHSTTRTWTRRRTKELSSV